MAAVFLHYEQGSAPFTCKLKTELGLAEALEKFSVKYRKKHGQAPPNLEARHNDRPLSDATWRPWWPSVLAELRTARGLLPLLRADMGMQLHPLCYATDASGPSGNSACPAGAFAVPVTRPAGSPSTPGVVCPLSAMIASLRLSGCRMAGMESC